MTTQNIPSDSTETSNSLCTLGLKTHRLLQRSLEAGLHDEVQTLLYINDHFLDVWAKANEAAQREATQQQEAGYTHYIWRTSGDNRVRSAHAQNEGRIFAWGSPPPTGHPGEDFGCRCRAEAVPYEMQAQQQLLTVVADQFPRWTDEDFVNHYYSINPRHVTLSETGYLGAVIQHYATRAEGTGIYDRVNNQILAEAVKVQSGDFFYTFGNVYNFGDVLFSFGDSTVSGIFVGNVVRSGSNLSIHGTITYYFVDAFTDPAQIVELIDYIPGFGRDDAIDIVGDVVDSTGTVYSITDSWQTEFLGVAVKK